MYSHVFNWYIYKYTYTGKEFHLIDLEQFIAINILIHTCIYEYIHIYIYTYKDMCMYM
jgi:hypothetical protein